MNWLQKNNYIVVLLTVFLIIVMVLLITDNGDTTYEKIEIEHGDTLWTLAEKYRGNLSHGDWIAKVKGENNLKNEIILVGQKLSVPISHDALNIAQNDADTIKVATNNDENEQ